MRKKFYVKAIDLLFIAGMVTIFVWGAERQLLLVNTDMQLSDQSAYMNYASKLRTTNFQYVGGRNRMPLYPGLMALFYQNGMTDEAFFWLGKQVGIGIALVILGLVFLIFQRYSSRFEALVATLTTAFTIFAYKAPFFQSDVLFYGITLGLFVLMLELLRKPHYGLAILAGALGGLAHLTKASILPAVALFCGCLLLWAGLRLVKALRHAPGEPGLTRQHLKANILPPFLCSLLFLGAFLLVIFPYIRTSKARFGQYFYNVNSTFYMWYDSWQEAIDGTRAHGDRVGWPDMPADQIPSFSKYIHEHTPRQIVGRFVKGAIVIIKTVSNSYGYAPFLLLYASFALLLFLQNIKRFLAEGRLARWALRAFFILAYVSGYFALYAWFTPISSGNRLVLGLFLPVLFCLLWVIHFAHSQNLGVTLWGQRLSASGMSLVILLALLAYLATTYPYLVVKIDGGA
jgi:hypothetical protein